ncbi:MAG: GNAT family N-acetyltransferase [Actinomycetia bacterium]|nr:GNAT family N-acetyltransferase [Actinomycetes bacterium]
MTRSRSEDEIDDFVERCAFASTLTNGAHVRIRPIAPKDKERLELGWRSLSSASRHLRFLYPKSALTRWELAYLTEIDYVNHFAWAAEALDEPDVPGIAIARYIRDPEDPTVAEAAIAVVDRFQHHGLGRILLQALGESAQENGIDRFRAYVSSENKNVIDVLTRLGAKRGIMQQNAVSLELPLPVNTYSSSSMYAALRTVAAEQAKLREEQEPV